MEYHFIITLQWPLDTGGGYYTHTTADFITASPEATEAQMLDQIYQKYAPESGANILFYRLVPNQLAH